MAALMISSQLLLTGFVVYWLMGQYHEERLRLHERLNQEYSLVHDQLVDSMLLKRLVLPSLEDTVRLEFNLSESPFPQIEGDSGSTIVMMKQFSVEVPDDSEVHAYHMEGSVHLDSGRITPMGTTVITNEERMVRSVKLFINENQDAFRSDSGMHVYAMTLDSSSLVLKMESALAHRDWTFNLEWPGEDVSSTELAEMHGIMLSGEPNRILPALRVQHFNAFLIRSILPQMFFGLIMLVLSASALLFAFRSLKKQLTLNKLRNDFIGNISHELKTPVSTVKIAIEALRTYDLKKDEKLSEEYLEMAASELERLERLVGKVLQHEMLDNPSLVLESEDCDLSEMARKVTKTFEIPIRKAGASVTISEEGSSCRVLVDRIYVEGVIMNLIDNSLKYAGPAPNIEVKIACDRSGSSLSVQDKGPGIPGEFKHQVFDKFFRIPAGDKHNVKGYGLGLNFAYQVMKQHGGSISFINLPEGGCRFNLQFPKTDS
jgi:signal transduction histidine kinase